jgi:2-phospho-L-lactate/phosphoenolpyruvate guanylyltransferase
VTVSRTGVVIPIRAFALGKARLAQELDPDERAALGRRLAEQVVGAASGLQTLVVSSDTEVRSWADHLHLSVIDDPGSLDAAAHAGRGWLATRGCNRVVIAHGDLPFAQTFAGVARDGSRPIVALVPCHRDDGTPVLSVPVEVDFEFAYGPGSFRRHAAEARLLGLALRVVRDPSLAFDVDLPEDLGTLSRAAGPSLRS